LSVHDSNRLRACLLTHWGLELRLANRSHVSAPQSHSDRLSLICGVFDPGLRTEPQGCLSDVQPCPHIKVRSSHVTCHASGHDRSDRNSYALKSIVWIGDIRRGDNKQHHTIYHTLAHPPSSQIPRRSGCDSAAATRGHEHYDYVTISLICFSAKEIIVRWGYVCCS